jgi:hypothetical protein
MDTTFFSYRVIRDLSGQDCRDTTNGSVLGLKIIKDHTGRFFFFNKTGDTIKINSQAMLNDSWKFCNLPGHGYIQAKMISVENDSVLGTLDTVKVFAFQAKDSLDNNISHLLNRRSIRLSQHYGLSAMLDVYAIPGDTALYVIAGKTNPKLGTQLLTPREIYNFEVGDIFHYQTIAVGWTFSIYKVLAKNSAGDSVTYTMEHCSKFQGPNSSWQDTIITVHDTVSLGYNIASPPVTVLPGEFIRNFIYANAYEYYISSFTGWLESYVVGAMYMFSDKFGSDTCWRASGGYSNFLSQDTYAAGLGNIDHNLYYFNSGQVQEMEEILQYYKKGSETWGIPVANDCFSLLGIEHGPGNLTIVLQVTPNPVETIAEIRILNAKENVSYYFILRDMLGRVVVKKSMVSNPCRLKRDGFPEGMYFFTVYDNDGIVTGGKKIIFK